MVRLPAFQSKPGEALIMSDDERCCRTCGYLGIEVPEARGELRLVGIDYRNDGRYDWSSFNAIPRCHKLAFDLPSEWTEATDRLKNVRQAAVEVIHRPRPICTSWIKWLPGHSPKEHDDMLANDLAVTVQQQLVEVQRGMLTLQTEMAQWKRDQSANEERLIAKRRALDYLFNFLLALVAAAVTLIAGKILPFFN
jgi:hypothetical protein